jgi:NDP-sugar pyrophosphorylase family protein
MQDYFDPTIEALYDLKETIAAELFKDKYYPWEILPLIHDYIITLGSQLPVDQYNKTADDIWIAKDAIVAPSASLNGPLIICPGAEIRHCAYIRGNAIIGEGAVVGNSTEIKNAILFNKVQVPHYNYVGDSILGYRAHMGAGSIASNVKADKALVIIKTTDSAYPTGLKKVGALLGDYVEIGCGTVLNPGTIVGPHTNIYPLSSVRGVIPPHSIYKAPDQIIPKNSP